MLAGACCVTTCTPAQAPLPSYEIGVFPVIARSRIAATGDATSQIVARFTHDRGYVVAAIVTGSHVELVRDARIARARAERYASIEIREIPDPRTALLSLQKSDLDMVYGLPADLVDEARASDTDPVRDTATGRWCAFAVGTVARDRVCPPGASVIAGRDEPPRP